MTAPIDGQDKILRYGTGEGVEPLLDTLASLARTALTDPESLPEEIATPLQREENRTTDPEHDPFVVYAVDRLDDIIEALNPSEETAESFAATLAILGRHLAERCDYLEATEPFDAQQWARQGEAVAHLQAALDSIDLAVEALNDLAKPYPNSEG